ncbi:AraC family transcriptional regulator [Salegentibacter sp. LM13S]|uniref:helix-turn-helix transcriptional regulator n=1 Tax=Salegentibacter lacus TaxID=2873599 RepID=UPI001CCC2BEC|nr:AraC family transcriptional regulator [Salegentibacter lacus]MBZ9629762.1 AraC family transcriptional regulator [Salegentibacter lacus]
MYFPDDKQFDQITRLITALANGDYDKRIKVSNLNNKLSTISVLLNMLAGVLKESIPAHSPENEFNYLNHIILLVDKKLQILDYNSGSTTLFQGDHLRNLNFILDNASITIVKEAIVSKKFNRSFNLNFRLKENLFLLMNTRITHFEKNQDDIFILSAVKTIAKDEWTREKLFIKAQNPKRQFNLSKNKKLIESLYHYLMDNLDSPLKPIPQIADELNTNATLLKRGFKVIHGKTIAEFHREKRLERARELVLDTDTKLNIVAQQCGFKSLSHFSRAFKKHYGVNPSDAR